MSAAIPTNCQDCPFHANLPDPDPLDWFCDDDLMVVCEIAERREVTVACRPYNARKESERPDWCPLISAVLLAEKVQVKS